MAKLNLKRVWAIQDRVRNEFKANINYIEALYLDKEQILEKFNNKSQKDDELYGVTKDDVDKAFDFLLVAKYIKEVPLYDGRYVQYRISDEYRKRLEEEQHERNLAIVNGRA